jgi:hypothetical protein
LLGILTKADIEPALRRITVAFAFREAVAIALMLRYQLSPKHIINLKKSDVSKSDMAITADGIPIELTYDDYRRITLLMSSCPNGEMLVQIEQRRNSAGTKPMSRQGLALVYRRVIRYYNDSSSEIDRQYAKEPSTWLRRLSCYLHKPHEITRDL